MPEISKRGIQSPSSPIRKLAPFAERAKAAGKHIYHLNIGQPDIPSPFSSREAVKLDDSEIIAYGAAKGMLELREAYANYFEKDFDVNLSAEDVIVTSGASEAIVFALNACCDPEEEIIIPEPFYANYIGFANFCAAKVVPVSSFLEDGFNLPSIDAFKACISSKTKVIVLCNPGNPTGKVYPKEDLEEIIELVIENDLFLIVDEVYKEFCYDSKFCSALEFEKGKEHVIIVDSVSKIFSLCGARVGFLTTKNKELQDTIFKFCQMRLCPPYHGQLLAKVAFENLHPYLDDVKVEYRKRRDTLYEELSRLEDVKIYMPEGAFYIIAGLPIQDAEAFCQWLISDFSYNNSTVMFAPAAGFYANEDLGKNQIRIAFILKSEDIRAAMKCLEMGLKAYQKVEAEMLQLK